MIDDINKLNFPPQQKQDQPVFPTDISPDVFVKNYPRNELIIDGAADKSPAFVPPRDILRRGVCFNRSGPLFGINHRHPSINPKCSRLGRGRRLSACPKCEIYGSRGLLIAPVTFAGDARMFLTPCGRSDV